VPDNHSVDYGTKVFDPIMQGKERDNKAKPKVIDKYLEDSQAEVSELLLCEARDSVILVAKINSEMQPNIHDLNQTVGRGGTLYEAIPEEDRSHKLEKEMEVLSDLSLPELPTLYKGETSIVKLHNVKKELRRMEMRNKLKDNKISKLQAENLRLKDDATNSKAGKPISSQTIHLIRKASTMRERREQIRKSTGITNNMLSTVDSPPSILEGNIDKIISSETSFEALPQSFDVPGLSFRSTPRKSRTDEESAKSSISKWTYSEPIVL